MHSAAPRIVGIGFNRDKPVFGERAHASGAAVGLWCASHTRVSVYILML